MDVGVALLLVGLLVVWPVSAGLLLRLQRRRLGPTATGPPAVPCAACDGSGAEPDRGAALRICSACRGTGEDG